MFLRVRCAHSLYEPSRNCAQHGSTQNFGTKSCSHFGDTIRARHARRCRLWRALWVRSARNIYRVAGRISHFAQLHHANHQHIHTSKGFNAEIAQCGMELNFDSRELLAAARRAERISHLAKLQRANHQHIHTSRGFNAEVAPSGMNASFDLPKLWGAAQLE